MKRLIYIIILILFVGCHSQIEDTPNSKEIVFVEKNEENQDLDFNLESLKADDKLIMASNIPKTLNPILNTDADIAQMLNLMFDTLINIEQDGSVSPNLAKYYTINYENNSVIVVLEDNIKWHDGTMLDAFDVVYSIQLLKETEDSIYHVNSRNMSYALALSSNTVQIFYNHSFSGVLQTLFFPVIPEHIYAKNVNSAPIGTGAYKLAFETPQKFISLISNEDYFKGKPNIPFIEVYYTPDNVTALAMFDRDKLDVVYTETMNWFKYDKNAKVYEIPLNKYEFIGINFDNKILRNINVRTALNCAIDKQNLINIYYLGKGVVSSTPISPNSYLYNGYEEKLTREMTQISLTKAGFTLENPLKLEMLINKDNQERLLVSEEIIKMYAEYGIIIIPEYVDEVTFNKRVYNKEYELFFGGWKFSYMPDFSFIFHSKSDNFINYVNKDMDLLLHNAFVAKEHELLEAYDQLQLYIQKELPYISLFFKYGALITDERISGEVFPLPLNIYNNIQLWTIE
ncbi:hypothetical protein AN641_10365 [Candidatus Epulonipiscioides gigas]|nr:hypothetical protein AN641_10365 [Epulopiscium sp. SCG-C07WGA-EpuloA2]